MKIASWNVNSLKVRLPHVLDWLASTRPDVLALQETKLTDDQFPHAAFREAGFHSVCSGQKTYNGVAIIATSPPTECITDIAGLDDPQRRILAATVDGVRIIDLYVVNGQEVGSEKFDYKLRWLTAVREFIRSQLQQYPETVVLGDFNIAPEDRDVHDPDAWREKILCSSSERQALADILKLGLRDSFRRFEAGDSHFSWWDYRAAGFRRNLGLRIDLLLASNAMIERCTAAGIDVEPRRLERPSDHTPVWAEFS